jgi:hypothetical protein
LRKGGTAKEKDGGERKGDRPMQVVSHNISFKRFWAAVKFALPEELEFEKDEMAHQGKNKPARLPAENTDEEFTIENR